MKKHFYSILRTISSIYGHYNLPNSETTDSGVDNVVNTLPENLDSVRGCDGIFKRLVQREYTSEKIPSKHQLNEFSLGRSMVEMLGVLAIIGVLSVGAISGYSKAMLKYKLNKHAEGFNMLLNDVLRYSSELKQDDTKWTHYGDLFHKLNLIPDGFKYVSNLKILDNFGNSLTIFTVTANVKNIHKGGIYVMLNSVQKEVCYNFVQTAKENSANLYLIEAHQKDTPDSHSIYKGHLWGDKYCTAGQKCLKDLKLNDLEALCDTDNLDQLYIIY